MKKPILTIWIQLIIGLSISAQNNLNIEPPFWWTNMPTETVQLTVNGLNIANYKASSIDPSVKIASQYSGDSRNYTFLYLNISADAKPGNYTLTFTDNNKNTLSKTFELKKREVDPTKNQGFSSKDVIYLLMPDRFANGDPKNDAFPDMLEKSDRTNPSARHGGDIKGISDRLNYIMDLGMTAVWLTPVFENDMTPEYGAYHGYAATDLYKIDKRLGTNDEFKTFVQKCHANGVRVIMDMIHNHIGDQHPWMKDMPTNDWVHDLNTYGTTNYRGVVQSDPYASEYDKAKLERAWFVPSMPDLNQRNPLLADYLIVNTLWWLEFSGIDGIRMDTYPYPYKDYMARWVKELRTAYPNVSVVGEAWVETVPHEAFWQEDIGGTSDGYNSNLPNVTDFQVAFSLKDAFTENFGWTSGLMRLYYVASQDRLYSKPMNNVIFMDNHDLERFFTVIGENKTLFQMAYSYIMTMRGIPQVYYGTELMFPNAPVDGDGRKRVDMPGGWMEDKRNVFTDGRTSQEQEAYLFVKKLTNWRKNSAPIHSGKMIHFIPENNVYVYFRYTETESVMVVINKNENPAKLSPTRFKEMLDKYQSAKDVMDGTVLDIQKEFTVPAMRTSVYELK